MILGDLGGRVRVARGVEFFFENVCIASIMFLPPL